MTVARFPICALLVLFAGTSLALGAEAYLDQSAPNAGDPAFLQQLPESALERPATTQPARKARPRGTHAGKRAATPAPKSATPLLPSVGRGATAEFQPAAPQADFPSVGAGTVRK
jgi:hypothetical protein